MAPLFWMSFFEQGPYGLTGHFPAWNGHCDMVDGENSDWPGLSPVTHSGAIAGDQSIITGPGSRKGVI